MLFNSFEFILLFLPLTLLLYFTVNKRLGRGAGQWLLIAASFIYYAHAGLQLLPVLLSSLAFNYALAEGIKRSGRKKPFLIIDICFNVLVLLYFKYFNFFIENINTIFSMDIGLKKILLPLGISFFTFQQISYSVSLYKNQLPEHGIREYLLYILYFPKLVMGPLAEPNAFIARLKDESRQRANSENIAAGVQRFALGLVKKVILADTFASAVNWGFNTFWAPSSTDWLLIIFAYSFQIYFDFSGYSDMAIGISAMLNIDLPENFNSPYKADSLRDFWKRWHMSLTAWLTKYIYIPLGGNRRGRVRTYINMLIVFLVSGLWHGASWTFVVWGLVHGLLCALERAGEKWYSRIPAWIRRILCFVTVSLLWLLFRCETGEQFGQILHSVIFCFGEGVSSDFASCFLIPELKSLFSLLLPGAGLRAWGLLGLSAFAAAAVIICFLCKNSGERRYRLSTATALGTAVLAFWGIISMAGESVFVYFGF